MVLVKRFIITCEFELLLIKRFENFEPDNFFTTAQVLILIQTSSKFHLGSSEFNSTQISKKFPGRCERVSEDKFSSDYTKKILQAI